MHLNFLIQISQVQLFGLNKLVLDAAWFQNAVDDGLNEGADNVADDWGVLVDERSHVISQDAADDCTEVLVVN